MNMLAPHLPRLCGFAHMPIAYLLLPFRALFSQLFPPLHRIPQRNTGMCVLTCMCVHTPVCVGVYVGVGAFTRMYMYNIPVQLLFLSN